MRVPALSKIVPIILVLGFATGCGSGASQPRPLNVVLISMDTTRADHLGCYGNDAIETPNINALAARSLRFERCFASVPITLPSHTTMLTGLYPLSHSVRDNGTFHVPGDVPTLATILGRAGRTTIGVIGAYPLSSQFGLSRDFDIWDEDFESRRRALLPLAFEQRSADRVTRTALERLDDGETSHALRSTRLHAFLVVRRGAIAEARPLSLSAPEDRRIIARRFIADNRDQVMDAFFKEAATDCRIDEKLIEQCVARLSEGPNDKVRGEGSL